MLPLALADGVAADQQHAVDPVERALEARRIVVIRLPDVDALGGVLGQLGRIARQRDDRRGVDPLEHGIEHLAAELAARAGDGISRHEVISIGFDRLTA